MQFAKYVSEVVKDGDKFYVKIIYLDGYTDTYTFRTEQVAKAFRQQMLEMYKITDKTKTR